MIRSSLSDWKDIISQIKLIRWRWFEKFYSINLFNMINLIFWKHNLFWPKKILLRSMNGRLCIFCCPEQCKKCIDKVEWHSWETTTSNCKKKEERRLEKEAEKARLAREAELASARSGGKAPSDPSSAHSTTSGAGSSSQPAKATPGRMGKIQFWISENGLP